MGISRVLPVALLLAGLGDLPPPPGPRYDATGALILPDGLDRWILVGSSLGLGYADPTDRGAGMFHQVYLAPRAYDAVRRTGRFPPGTMFALVAAPPGARVTPARQGVYAETPVRVELAVKDPVPGIMCSCSSTPGFGTRRRASGPSRRAPCRPPLRTVCYPHPSGSPSSR